ncbi:hypothetical protein LOTGIDRAFT_231431 [Lottia gigantea]|uniref:VWFD domain-containing protein n=1 Tax=Lottia gigantea TaxID=225164 RepID=V4AXR2_LOTGI|nr:hypothetical protein LOTGIDRAFT_231431 [Lottia gigantea]ESO98381.1 hypothetical protein LOTGIDRAFT_231431 [Lottia gigantea]
MNIKPLKTGISSNSKDKDSKDKDSKDKDSKDKDSKDKDSKDSKDKNSKGKKSNGKKSRRRRAPGSKEKKNTGEKHTKEKHTNEKHTKEKDTKEKHTKEKHTNEKDTKEKHTKEKNTKEKNTKEKNSKEKDYMNTDKLEVQCKRLVQSWKCIQFQIVSAKTPRNLAINLTIASFYQLALHKCQVLQNTELTCHSCTHKPDNEECNKEPSQTCSGNQMCQTVVETDDNGDKKWSKGCIDIDQCKPGRYYNKYTHCCRGDYCNAESVAPVHGGCNIEAAKVCSRRLVIGLLLTEDLNCSVLDEELSCMVDVRKECVETGHKWHLQTVDLLHKSSEAKQCRLKQLDTDCGVNSIRSLYQSLKNPDILVDDLCSLLDVVGKKVQAVRSDPRCSDKLKDINISYLVIWYRFNGVKCREVLPVCINDKKENCNANPVCDYIEIIQECFHTQKYEGLDTCQTIDCDLTGLSTFEQEFVNIFKKETAVATVTSTTLTSISTSFEAIIVKPTGYLWHVCSLAKTLTATLKGYADDASDDVGLTRSMTSLDVFLINTCGNTDLISIPPVIIPETETETVCGTCDDVAAAKCFSDGLAMFESPDVSDVNTICSQTLETTMKCVYQAIARCEDKTAFEASLNKFIADYDNICTIPADISSYTIPCSIPSGSVSDKCKAGRKRVDACFTTQISAILAKQFIGYREMRSYCSYGRKFEECYDNELTDCNEDEVSDIAMSREIIQNYVKIECGDDLTVKPQCEPEMAKQCVDTLITDLGDGSGSGHKCRSLERTIKCYDTYTFNCKSDDITAIKYRLERVIHSHRYTCKQLLQPWSCSTSGDESDSGTDGMETGGDAKGDGTSGNTVDLTVCDKTSALACFSSFTLTSLPSCSDFKSMMNCAVRSVIGCEDNVVIETVDSLNNNFLNAASLTSSCIAKTSVEKLNAQFKLIKDKATTSNEKVCSAEEALKCFDFLKPDTNIPCPTFKEMKRCSMLNIEKCTSDVRDTAITSINSAISAFLTASTTFVPSCIQTVTKDNLLSIGMVPKPSFSLTLDKCVDFSIKPSNIIQCVLLKYQNKETIDCDLTGLSTFEQEFVNIFKKETAVATVTSTTLTSISTSFEAIIVKPTGYLWHVCSLAKTLTATLKGYADDASDDVGLTRSMTSLDVFLINTCGNTDLISIPPVIIPETEKDECNKDKINRIITPALLKYLFSSYLTSGDICSDASMVKIMVKDELTECSDEYKEHISVVLQLLTTLAKPACFTSPKCNVQKAYGCLSQLNAEIALFGIENTPRDICRALSTNDVCMEHYLGDCHPDRLHLIRYVSNKDRLVAFTICSGEQVQVQPVCQSQYIGRTEGELKCSKLDSGCSNSLFKDFYLPDDGALCSASARLGQCQVGFEPKCFNSLPSTYLTSSKTYFSSECDSSKYIVPCSADCDPRKIRGCFDTFFNSVDPFWNLMDSEGKCREVQKARQCVRMATKKCDKQSRDKAIYKLSRLVIAYGEENCPDGYDCMTEFTMLAKKIFIASEIITKPDKDSSSKSTDSDDTSESSDSEDKDHKATKESKDKKSNGKKSRRKRAPGAKDKKNTKEKNTKEKNTKEKSTKEKNTKEKNTKEKNTKEKNTKEKNTKEKNTKEKNTKEKNTKEKNTKEMNTKEKATKENTKEKNTKEKSTKEKNTKEHNTKETKEKNTQEKHSMEKPDIDLSALCHKAKMLWKCIEGSYGTISINYNDQIAYLSLYGIWSSVKERCSKTVKQSCYRCYGEADEKECFKKTEVCSHHSQMCQSFAGVSTKTGVFEHSKGCVRPSQCKRGCNSMGCTDCCIGELCNEKLQVTGVVDTKVCDVSKAVDCSLMLLKNMHDDGGCTESYQKLECMIEYSKDCLSDSRKEISRSASKIVKVLARNSCPPPISQQCNSAAILAFQTALSNPYVAGKDAICKQRLDALAALTSLSASSTCSPIDIVVYQQVMTDSERLIRDFCLSGTEQCMVPLTVDITIDIEVSVSHVKKSQCARELANFGICLANGMMKLKTGFDDASCGEVSQKKCMSKELKSCNVPKGLNDLGSELATFKASGCTVDDPAPKDCSIATLTKCDIAESYNCLHDLDKTKTNFCQDLTASRSCVQSSTSGCLSIQELSTIDLYNTYRKESKTVCLAAQVPGPLEVKVDVFTGYSTCLEIFGEALGTAFESDDFEAKICKALDESDTCIDQVPMPELTKPLVTATVNKYRDGMSTFMRTCSSETPGGDIGDGVDRVKRDTSGDKCDIKQAGFCLSKLSMISQTLPVIHYSDHLTFCRSMQEYETCVKDNIKECTNKKKTGLMVTILESLISSSEQYCVLQVLEEPSCNIEYAEECIETFTVLTSYSSYTHEQICRNAEVTLKCVKKFTTECSDADQSTRVRGKITTIVQSVVGNDCPSVTALLFCDGADIDATCNAEEAKSCFTTLKKKLLDVSSRLADKEEYCRVVTKNWKCLRQSVQGCTETVFNQLTADVDAEFLVRVKASGCDGVDSDPIPQTCIAEPTCSIDSLYTCIDDFTTKAKDDKASACSSVDSHITCITSQSGCTEPQKLVVLTELTTVSNALCGTAVSIAQTVPELVCLQTFVQDLASEILNPSKPGVRGMCDLFTSYSSCFGAASFDELGDVISNFYGVSGDILSKFVDAQALCKNDPTDSKVVKIDLIKGLSTVSCVVRQLSSVLVRRLLPLTEKEMICSKTSYVESCISEKISGLTTDESAFFTKVTTLTDSLTTNIEFCQEPQLCLLKEVTVCVQDLQTEIATFETSGERSQVCRCKDEKAFAVSETHSNTAACSNSVFVRTYPTFALARGGVLLRLRGYFNP